MTSVSKNQHSVKSSSRRQNCGRWTYFRKNDDGSYAFGPLYCESWNCPACREVKISKLVERLHKVDVVQYIEIFFYHRPAEVRSAFKVWLRTVKRQFRNFEYFLAIRSEPHTTRAGLFLATSTIPPRYVEESFAFFGLRAEAQAETLYRPEGRRDKLAGLLNCWAVESTFIHRIAHSRGFFQSLAGGSKPAREISCFVSRAPVGYWLELFAKRGFEVAQISPDRFQVFGFVIQDPRAYFGADPVPG